MLLTLRNEHITNIGEPFEFIWPEVNPLNSPFRVELDHGFPLFLHKKIQALQLFFGFTSV